MRAESQKVCSNRPTRLSTAEDRKEWRSYVHTFKKKIWEDLVFRVSFPDSNGNSSFTLSAYSNKGTQEVADIFKNIHNDIKHLLTPETNVELRSDLMKVSKEINTTTEDVVLQQNITEVKNYLTSLLPIFVKHMHGIVAGINSLIPVEDNLDYVKDWKDTTDQVLVLAGSFGYKVAKEYGVYVCQNKRSFRSSKYIAFYDDGKIQEVFEILGKPYDNATSLNTVEMLKMSMDMANYSGNVPSRCFKLKSIGMVGPIINDSKSKTGKPVPFTYGQPRYTTFELIKKSKKTSELINGLQSNYITDSFINNRKSVAPMLDILWVIDNSGSMASYQNALASNFDSFISKFMEMPINEIPDFKMAITTTDEKNNGGINDGQGMLDKFSAFDEDLKDLFLHSFITGVNVGTLGSVNERGIKCSYLAVEKNRSFFREDAMLIINIVTDEDDDDSHSIDDYLSKINNLKIGQRVIFNVIGLSGFKRYEYAVNKTKGKYLNIKNDFSLLLDDMSKQMVEVTSSFALSNVPVNAPNIVVKIDGKQSADFIYTESSNTLKVGKSVPEGASIDIEYEIEEN
ncbi:MAG: hypothetical protein EBV19_04435 [Flavobacteriia bacterium]|nr:hypothetical protein [Flavobacteriia bacterium]